MESQFETQFLALRKKYIEAQFGKLNPVQRDAVFTTDGPLLILAGAGSGKTTVLINRIANLMRYGRGSDSPEVPGWVTGEDLAFLEAYAASQEQPAPEDKERQERLCALDPAAPWTILAITFTNKAAGELKERLARMLGPSAEDVWASTFHSACVRILRRDIERLGFSSSFTIYDTDDSLRVIKDCMKELEMDDKQFPPRSVLGYISRAKDEMLLGEDYLARCEKSGDFRLTKIARIYVEYQRRLWEASALDFDDIILHTVRLLQKFDDVREYYQKKFRYVLIDEYQDTNNLQYLLASTLAGGYENFCVVGDDDQSIYRFRGATIENILSFEKQYPKCRTIRLEENYRSTRHILEASNAVIRNNQGRKGKELWTKAGEGEKLHLYTAMNENDEARFVADRIVEDVAQGRKWKDHAILYRMNAQSAPIESYFTRAGIPHKIVGGQRFNDRKEVKDIHSYMSIVANPRDDVRLRRIINEPARKIGNTTVEVIADLAAQQGVSMLEIIGHADQYAKLSRAVMPLLKFWQIYQSLQDSLETKTLDAFAADVIERTGYKAMLEADAAKGHEDAADRLQNLGQLVNNVKNYCDQHGEDATLEGYLEDIALISDIDSYNESADQVVLMTIHSAKGLEFPYVFLIGMEEGVFPSEMSRCSSSWTRSAPRVSRTMFT